MPGNFLGTFSDLSQKGGKNVHVHVHVGSVVGGGVSVGIIGDVQSTPKKKIGTRTG